jgi:hypothetical protein
MKEMQQKCKRIQTIQDKIQAPPQTKPYGWQTPSSPSQSSNARSIKGFGENISQLSLCVNVFHHYISFLNMVSQEVVSHFYVFCSPMKNWILGWHMALELSHMRGILL